MTTHRSTSLTFATLVRKSIPRITDEFVRSSHDAAQTIVWLVGLATTLLTLAGAYPERVRHLLQDDYKTAIAALLVTVIAGVIYRVLGLHFSDQQRNYAMALSNHLTGYEAGALHSVPSELSENWDEVELARRLHMDFGLDYSFLLHYRVPLDGCRQAYKAQFDIWKLHEETALAGIQKTVAAYTGRTSKETRAMLSPFTDADLRKIRTDALILRGCFVLNGIVFSVAALAFMAAVFCVARALWIM